jgi:hypothetical protein
MISEIPFPTGVDRDAYRKDGFAVCSPGLEQALLESAADLAARLARRSASDVALLEHRDLRETCPEVAAVATGLRPTAQYLMNGPSVDCRFDEVLALGPLGPGTLWHQDMAFAGRLRTNAVTFWIPLQPVDERNGAMRYVAGSHRHGLLPHQPSGGGRLAVQHLPPGVQTTVPLEVGQCVAHDGYVVHGSHENASPSTRLALAVQFRPRWRDAITWRYTRQLRRQTGGRERV